ncbi:MAG: T9SS type A sorting domain-containing protein, partial [bacterium]
AVLNSVKACSDSSFIVTGSTDSLYSGPYAVTIKVDYYGEVVWRKSMFGETGNSRAYSCILTEPEENCIITGTAHLIGFPDYAAFIRKYSEAGDVIWTKYYHDTNPGNPHLCGKSIKPTNDNGLIIAGERLVQDTQFLWVLKTDANGDSLWSRSYPLNHSFSEVTDIAVTSSNEYFVCGQDYPPDGFFIYKLDSNGDTIWTKTYLPDPPGKFVYSMIQSSDSNLILAGGIYPEAAIFKIDYNGTMLWSKQYKKYDHLSLFNSISELTDSGFIAAGFTQDWNANPSAFIVRTDNNGDTLWTKINDLPGQRIFYGIDMAPDDGFIACGTYVYSGLSRMYLVKFDEYGNGFVDVTEPVQQNPNPIRLIQSDNQLIIKILSSDLYSTEVILSIFDITGHEMEVKQILINEHPVIIDIFNYKNGLYLLHIQSDHIQQSCKFLKL